MSSSRVVAARAAGVRSAAPAVMATSRMRRAAGARRDSMVPLQGWTVRPGPIVRAREGKGKTSPLAPGQRAGQARRMSSHAWNDR